MFNDHIRFLRRCLLREEDRVLVSTETDLNLVDLVTTAVRTRLLPLLLQLTLLVVLVVRSALHELTLQTANKYLLGWPLK